MIIIKPTQWEDLLPHAEFSYNQVPHKTTRLSSFAIIYTCNLLTPLDLASFISHAKFSYEANERAQEIRKLHEQVHDRIVKMNEKVKSHIDKRRKKVHFQEEDLVWVHLSKERFPKK